MQNTEDPTDAELRAWDWYADLKADERGIPWLARRTGKAQSTLFNYRYGHREAPIEWLRKAAAVLGKDAAA